MQKTTLVAGMSQVKSELSLLVFLLQRMHGTLLKATDHACVAMTTPANFENMDDDHHVGDAITTHYRDADVVLIG